MDLEDLTVPELVFRFAPQSLNVSEVSVGHAIALDAAAPPVITVNSENGTIVVKNADGSPLRFVSGGLVLALRVVGGAPGETFLVVDNPDLRTAGGQSITAAVAGGRIRVE
jgi:hypothetical protein